MNSETNADIQLPEWRERALEFERACAQVVVGQERAIRLLTISVFARGHVLLEGDVGVGKTTLLRAAARAIGGEYERVEGTIDLMPGDLVYHTYLDENGRPRVEPGPVLHAGEALSIFFFNEINRARPQVHSLLLRLMAERSLAAFNQLQQFPYLQVFADRNQVEREETFELPAAARDRFFMEIPIELPEDDQIRRDLIFDPRYYDADSLVENMAGPILDHTRLDSAARAIQRQVHASNAIQDYVTALWRGIRFPHQTNLELDGVDLARLVQGGASPRGLAFLIRAARVRAWLHGRDMLVPEDIRDQFSQVMAHRVFLNPVYELHQKEVVAALFRAVFDKVPTP
jgi:MoxR-like ATPase